MLVTDERDGRRIYRETETNRTAASVTVCARDAAAAKDGDEYAGVPPKALEQHALEGEGCHHAALNWLAFHHGWQQEFAMPEPPERHTDAGRWRNVCTNGLIGAQAWFTKREVVPLLIEQPSVNWLWGIAGCPDLLCHLTWRGRRVCAIVELKFTAKLILSHRVQIRLYRKLQGYEAGRMGLLVRVSRDDGQYEEKPVYWDEEPELDALALQMANKLR